MDRKVAVLAVVFALAVGSDGALKCYICNTATNSSCGDDIMNSGLKPVECTSANIKASYSEAFNHPLLSKISQIFETDTPQHGNNVLPDPACAKMDVTVETRKVTIRNCQIAKTELMDPCEAVKGKLAKLSEMSISSLMPTLEFCGVCENDACNGAMAMVPKAFYMIFPLVTALALGNGNYMA